MAFKKKKLSKIINVPYPNETLKDNTGCEKTEPHARESEKPRHEETDSKDN